MAIISKLKAVLTLDNKQFKKGLDESKGQVEGFSGSIGKLGGAIAGAFSVAAVVNFTKELANIQHTANAVGKAFDRLGITIESLRSATGGGIGDLRLKQMAVQAANLGLPIQKLATYFEFATIRAAETGESIDYLVNSIVTGIGRKSIMILDNLGISAIELQKEFEKTGDFAAAAGNIIEREMGESTITIYEAVSGMDRLNTATENFMLAASVNGEHLNRMISAIAGAVKVIGNNLDYAFGVTERWLRVWSFGASDYVIDWLVGISKGLDDVATSANKIPAWLQHAYTTDNPLAGLGPVGGDFPTSEPAKRTSTASSIDSQGDRGVFADSRNYLEGWEKTAEVLEKMGGELPDIIVEMRELGEVVEMAAPSDEDIQAWEDYKSAMEETLDVSGYVVAGISELANAIGSIAGGADTQDALASFIDGIAGLLQQFGSLLIAWGVGKIALKNLSGPAAIAAGVALVAIGGAISSNNRAVSSYASSGSGGYSGAGGGYSIGGYDYNREVVMVARGPDLVTVLNKQQDQNWNNG